MEDATKSQLEALAALRDLRALSRVEFERASFRVETGRAVYERRLGVEIISVVLFTFAVLTAIVGVLVALLILAGDEEYRGMAVTVVAGAIVSAAVLYAAGLAVQLLGEIADNTSG